MVRVLSLIALSFVVAAGNCLGKLQVVASQTIIADWVKNIGGEYVEVTALVPANGDVHTFEPTPMHARAISEGDIIFENGLGFEVWMDKLEGAAKKKEVRYGLADVVKPIELACRLSCGHTHAVNGKEVDPHVWMDVGNAILMSKRIADILSKKDPANEKVYKTNALEYVEKLEELDAYIREQSKLLGAQGRVLITNHESLNYFAKAYGFETPGSLYGATSTDVGEPSARGYAKLLKLIKKTGVKSIFRENIQNSRLIEQLSKDAKLKKPAVIYTGNLSKDGGVADTYIKMMRYNVDTIVEALR